MTIAPMMELLVRARREGYALGYFEAWDQYSLEATLEAAEEARAPAILGFGGAVTSYDWLERRGVEELGNLAVTLAQRASVPTAVLFNEARTIAHLQRGLLCGCNAVMLDSSALPYAEHLARTCELVQLAHAHGAAVEAELGHLADAGDTEGGTDTDPVQAAHFVASTGVDALAVAIGNVHMLLGGRAQVNLDLLAQIGQATGVPLVIHGGSGFPGEAVSRAIACGVAKFNVGTRLKWAYLQGVREGLEAISGPPNVQQVIGTHEAGDIFSQGAMRLKTEVRGYLHLYGSAGKA